MQINEEQRSYRTVLERIKKVRASARGIIRQRRWLSALKYYETGGILCASVLLETCQLMRGMS